LCITDLFKWEFVDKFGKVFHSKNKLVIVFLQRGGVSLAELFACPPKFCNVFFIEVMEAMAIARIRTERYFNNGVNCCLP
jgi:hypothetical protein